VSKALAHAIIMVSASFISTISYAHGGPETVIAVGLVYFVAIALIVVIAVGLIGFFVRRFRAKKGACTSAT
jgi:hypothetical protein